MNQLIKDQHPYQKIHPNQLQDYFNRVEKVDQTLSHLLLNNESTAIFHVDSNRVDYLGDPKDPTSIPFADPLLLGVNYHHGSSEGLYKIVVQNIPERRGPWVLFRPPGSNEHTLYLQNTVFPRTIKPKFEENVIAPLKIRHFYLFQGDPLQIFRDFEAAGFNFVDHAMPEEHLEDLIRRSFTQK